MAQANSSKTSHWPGDFISEVSLEALSLLKGF